MGLMQLGRAMVFLAGAVVGGLALAFILVLLRPELLPRLRPAGPAAVVPQTPPGPQPTADATVANVATVAPAPERPIPAHLPAPWRARRRRWSTSTRDG